MIIWEKVTIQDSSAKFSLALDSDHSGLRLSDTNDALANLSLNKLIATNLKLGNGLEYIDGNPVGQFNFASPVNFNAIIYANNGLTTTTATLTGALNVGGATTITGKLTVNNGIKTNNIIEGSQLSSDDDLTLSFHNGSVFQVQCSTGNNAENIIDSDGVDVTCHKSLQVNGDCGISGQLNAANFGKLVIPPTLWLDVSSSDGTSAYIIGSVSSGARYLHLRRPEGSHPEGYISDNIVGNSVHTKIFANKYQYNKVDSLYISDRNSGYTPVDKDKLVVPTSPSGGGDGIYISLTGHEGFSPIIFDKASIITIQQEYAAVVAQWGGPWAVERIMLWAWAVQHGYKFFYFEWGGNAWYGGELQNMNESAGIPNHYFVGIVYFTVNKPYYNLGSGV